MEQILFSRKQAAALLGISYRSIEEMNKTGALPFIKVGRRVLIHTDVLKQFAQSGHDKGVRQ